MENVKFSVNHTLKAPNKNCFVFNEFSTFFYCNVENTISIRNSDRAKTNK